MTRYVLEFENGSPASDYDFLDFEDAKEWAGELAISEGVVIRVVEQEFTYADSSLIWDTESGLM